MTHISHTHFPQQLGRKTSSFREDIIGPYSKWPRRMPPRTGAKVKISATIVGASIFAHCALPLIF